MPSYKELFPSHINICNSDADSSPSYNDYIEKLVNHQSTTILPISSQV
jgi:hypothetical protein